MLARISSPLERFRCSSVDASNAPSIATDIAWPPHLQRYQPERIKNTARLWHRCREPTTSVGIGVGLSCTLTGFLRYSRTSSRRVLSRTHQPANSLARWTPRSAGCDHDSGNQEGGSVVLLGSTEGGPPIIEPQPHKISPQKYNRRESGGHPHCTLRKCFC